VNDARTLARLILKTAQRGRTLTIDAPGQHAHDLRLHLEYFEPTLGRIIRAERAVAAHTIDAAMVPDGILANALANMGEEIDDYIETQNHNSLERGTDGDSERETGEAATDNDVRSARER